MADPQNISHKIREGVAIVTGAGAGLGRALSLELISRGVQVVGLGRRQAPLDEVAQNAASTRFHPIVADIGDRENLAGIFARICTEIGPPTLLVNNAAVYPHRDILDETPQSFMDTVGINLGGVFYCCHAVLPHMVDQGFGRIINIGSFADISPAPVSAAYSVSKGAARILTRALVADLGDRFPDIIINDWMPGILKTQMGLSDGLDPKDVAVLGVNLALWHERSLNGVVFELGQEVQPQLSFKRRLFNKVTGRKTPPRNLVGRS